MSWLARFVAGRRTKWLVLVFWLLLVVLLSPLAAKVSDVTNDTTEASLPKNAESTKVLHLQTKKLEGGQTIQGLVVYQRPGGRLNELDQAKIERDAVAAADTLPLVGKPELPFTPTGQPRPGAVSSDGSVAILTVTTPNNNDKSPGWGKDLRKIVDDGAPAGLKHYVTGDLGFNADFDEVFGSLDTKLLAATVLLVFILLGAIYRAPLTVITPLIVVGIAYQVANAFVYAYGKSGANVNQTGTSILVVLMFGVGTDYCLLLVSRYREELRRHADKHEAMQVALGRVGPAILASGLTVSAAMLVLLVADARDVQALGPVAAIGVTSAFLAGLTLLPAMLTIFGRAAFWPRKRIVAFDPDHQVTEKAGTWRRVGDAVLKRPVLALVGTTAFFAVGALGLLAYKESFSTTNAFKKQTESVDGFKVLQKVFPAGTLAPTNVLIAREGGQVTPADVQAVRARVARTNGVAEVTPVAVARSRDGTLAQLNVTLKDDPFTTGALGTIPKIRDQLKDLPPGVTALVGGGSATQRDYEHASKRDIKIIVPFALAVIAVILGILLTAVVAPIVLIGTVIISFFGTLGFSVLFIRFVVGDEGMNTAIPTFAFIFLVALGTDYTIFLMSRVREEARKHGTREGMLRALAATGAVITSAGIILAGTFSVLMTLPVTFVFDLGFIVAVGILLDTFLVRTIMVPAAVELIGDKIWWPSTAAGGGRVLHEKSEEEPELEPAGV